MKRVDRRVWGRKVLLVRLSRLTGWQWPWRVVDWITWREMKRRWREQP